MGCLLSVATQCSRSLGRVSLLLGCLLLAGCYDEMQDENAVSDTGGGDPQRGAELIGQFGCGSCHTIPGIRGADGVVGPPLTMMGRRIYIAGMLRNSPDNMMMWLENPQRVVPGNAMPNMGVSEQEARDVAAYLSNLR